MSSGNSTLLLENECAIVKERRGRPGNKWTISRQGKIVAVNHIVRNALFDMPHDMLNSAWCQHRGGLSASSDSMDYLHECTLNLLNTAMIASCGIHYWVYRFT